MAFSNFAGGEPVRRDVADQIQTDGAVAFDVRLNTGHRIGRA